MTAPSKMTKAELRGELDKMNGMLTRERQLVQKYRNDLTVKKNNLHAEVKVGNEIRRERDKYYDRFGAIKKTQYTVDIRSQIHYPSDSASANKLVRGLLDLGVWFFDVGETKK